MSLHFSNLFMSSQTLIVKGTRKCNSGHFKKGQFALEKHRKWRGGISLQNKKCLDCDKLIHYQALRCRGCYYKIPISEESRKKMSDARKGKPSWNKGKQNPWTTLRNLTNNPSKSYLPEVKAKLSKAFSGEKNHMFGRRGILSPGYKGGITPLGEHIKAIPEYLNWRKTVFKRDEYTCQMCGDKTGHNLEGHHIKSFAQILLDNNIKTVDDARNCKELWNVDNGLTLCRDCHKLTDTYARNIRHKMEMERYV